MKKTNNVITTWFEVKRNEESLNFKNPKELEIILKDLVDLKSLLNTAKKYKFKEFVTNDDCDNETSYFRIDFKNKVIEIDSKNNIKEILSNNIKEILEILDFKKSKIEYTDDEIKLIKKYTK